MTCLVKLIENIINLVVTDKKSRSKDLGRFYGLKPIKLWDFGPKLITKVSVWNVGPTVQPNHALMNFEKKNNVKICLIFSCTSPNLLKFHISGTPQFRCFLTHRFLCDVDWTVLKDWQTIYALFQKLIKGTKFLASFEFVLHVLIRSWTSSAS